jgi:arylsulfatase A-like enzyme
LNCFGSHHIKSPNIDKVADGGIIFKQAYCQVPVCGASRASLLTSVRPNLNRFVDYHTWADEDVPGVLTLPEHFKNNGYHTISNGKIFHHKLDKKESWSELPWVPLDDVQGRKYWRDYLLPENIETLHAADGAGPAFEKADVEDIDYFDGKLAERSINDLKRLKEMNKPFFLAAGFYKPHLPFNAPAKYWDLYDADQIRLPGNPHKPENAPDASMHNSGELRAYTNIPKEGPVSDSIARLLIHGYYACVSYTDAQIGKLLSALEELGIEENTIVIIWGDHGWNLGEHGLWCKHCNYETSLRAPIILKVPWLKGNLKTNALVEFVDIYPTLCELSGLEIPAHVQGESLVKYISDPDLPGKPYVFSRWKKGESVKNPEYRYTEWFDSTQTRYAEMLYDHQNDSDENYNISLDEENADLIKRLREENLENRIQANEEVH